MFSLLAFVEPLGSAGKGNIGIGNTLIILTIQGIIINIGYVPVNGGFHDITFQKTRLFINYQGFTC